MKREEIEERLVNLDWLIREIRIVDKFNRIYLKRTIKMNEKA